MRRRKESTRVKESRSQETRGHMVKTAATTASDGRWDTERRVSVYLVEELEDARCYILR